MRYPRVSFKYNLHQRPFYHIEVLQSQTWEWEGLGVGMEQVTYAGLMLKERITLNGCSRGRRYNFRNLLYL